MHDLLTRVVITTTVHRSRTSCMRTSLNYPITNQAQLHRSARTCRYRLKFYDHAVINHIVDMSKVLKERGLSLAVVSSKFLEANNKVVKAIMRRLPGWGRHTGSCAHLPLVQGLKRCIAASRVCRVELYKSIQNEEVDESVLD
jgi:hypothetical protein